MRSLGQFSFYFFFTKRFRTHQKATKAPKSTKSTKSTKTQPSKSTKTLQVNKNKKFA